MQAIIAMIVSFFGFFKWGKIVDYALRAFIFSKMVIINAILGGLILSYATAVLYIINFIYSKFNFVVDYVNNLPTGNDKILTTALSFIKSLGAWNALCDVMAIFSPIFLSFFLIYATKIGIVVFKFVRETILSFVVAKS
ncbi:hypothetical protein [Campylobacter concisus]|uniref:hypothetical protein n=1 Tax=Campylobacter concisus TaxID=199 RepID=UPI0018831BA3|nr:hypothetical protein [Campylobacter concisus]